MKAKIKVTYNVGDCPTAPCPKADKKIKQQIKSIGGKWYAQGGTLHTGERDICFELDIKI